MKMKIIHSLSFILLIALTACSQGAQEDVGIESGETTGLLDTDYENALPVNMQLLLGTFALDDTAQAIEAEQAAELLPLWKAARALTGSETVAEDEMEAIFNQIQETMTPEQMAALAEMQLTREDMGLILQKYNLAFGRGPGFDFENLTPEQQATLQAARESGGGPGGGGNFNFPGGGGFPGGGFPGGGFPGGGQGGFSPEARQTAIAERGGRFGAQSGINPAFFDAVIEFLEAKVT